MVSQHVFSKEEAKELMEHLITKDLNEDRKVYVVTGATGYIGSQLVKSLVKEGHFVEVLVREDKDYPEFKNESVMVTVYNKDESSIEHAVEWADHVIHLGALYTTENHEQATIDLIESNVLFSTQLFNAVRNINPDVTIAIASTFSSLGKNGELAPTTLYAATKSAVETIASYYKDLSIHFLTFPDTYGPNDWRPKIHNILMKNNVWPFQFRSPSNQMMRLMHVEDIIGHLISSGFDNSKGVHFHDIYDEGTLISLKGLSELITNKECLFNDDTEIIEIPKFAREISKFTGYKNKHKEIKFE